MTSAIGNLPKTRPAGFSLIEILLVLALMAIGGTVVILNFQAYADRGQQNDTVEVLTRSVQKARFFAVEGRVETQLRFDAERGCLLVERAGLSLYDQDLGSEFRGYNGNRVIFLRVPSAEGLESPPPPSEAEDPITHVRFAPDGSCTPFVAEINSGSGKARRLAFDPFSNLRKDLE
ncbi:MAG: Uncharacterised protein [Opitutia bacterium UBA7350]|nr:MAG: Uncharacterised protein [Opitutae bacterium UBA7350]